MGILGGLSVTMPMLGMSAETYFEKSVEMIPVEMVLKGVLKSAVFAALVAGVGCLRGFQVSGGAIGVGRATTSAVVSSIFLVILADSAFNVVEVLI
jgi:phospholipid/cholesterol/gamma-HCH transport system permease protein